MEVSDSLPTSHLSTLIDRIELILTSPADFTSSTSKTVLAPLLAEINTCTEVDELHDRVVRVERWCNQLGDATRAANAREIITQFLDEIESWQEWQWQANLEEVQEKKRRVEQIKKRLSDLPVEWLKTRVTGISLPTCELTGKNYGNVRGNFILLHI